MSEARDTERQDHARAPEAPKPPAIVPTSPPRPIEVLPRELYQQLTRPQLRLLVAYAVRGTVTAAAQLAGVHRSSHNRWLEEEAYAKAFELVQEAYADLVEDEVRARALEGWYEPVFQGGALVGHKLVKSDRLLELHAKARRPKLYREGADAAGAGGVTLVLQVIKYADALPASAQRPAIPASAA